MQTLEDMKGKNMPLPKVLYLVPNGQNPVSYVAPLGRKQALYHVCRKHGLMIVEDDPYFYLQFPFDGMHTTSDDAMHCRHLAMYLQVGMVALLQAAMRQEERMS